MAKYTKTALERLEEKDEVGPYRVTDEIVLQPLTGKQAKELEDITDTDERFKLWFGDQYDAMMDLLDSIPIHYVAPLFRDMAEHFFKPLLDEASFAKLMLRFDASTNIDFGELDIEDPVPAE